MLKNIFVIFLLAAVAGSIEAQLHITSQQILIDSRIIEVKTKDDSLYNLALSGPNQTWDLRNVGNWASTYQAHVTRADSTPYGSSFPVASRSYIYGDNPGSRWFDYEQIADHGIFYLGWVNELENPPTAHGVTPPLLSMTLPCTYGTSWSGIIERIYDIGGGHTIRIRDSSFTVVNGWGTLLWSQGPSPVLLATTTIVRQTWQDTLIRPVLAGLERSWIDEHGDRIAVLDQPMVPPGSVLDDTLTATLTIRETVGDLAIEPVRGSAVQSFAIGQNYPNPFNPNTQIEYDLKNSGFVSLKVYNLLGQQVATLVNGKMIQGRHTATFDAEHLPSGVYVYRMESSGFVDQKKMLLMK